MENQKKKQFTNEEKSNLRELVFKYRDTVENKKSDTISLAKKKKGWDKITEEFNSVGSHTKRTSLQLKKLWENIKFRRRSERKKAGGGKFIPKLSEDPELDNTGVEIEMEGAIYCDTPVCPEKCVFVDDMFVPSQLTDGLQQIMVVGNEEEGERVTVDDTPILSTYGTSTQDAGMQKTNKPDQEDLLLRAKRNAQFIEHDAQIHACRLQEYQLKKSLLLKQLENEEKVFQLKQQNLIIERDILLLQKEDLVVNTRKNEQ